MFDRRLKLDKFDYNQTCSQIATMIEGLSGREISKLAVAWQVCTGFADNLLFISLLRLQASAYASHDGLLTEKMVMERVSDAIEQHKRKLEWQAEEERVKRAGLTSKERAYSVI